MAKQKTKQTTKPREKTGKNKRGGEPGGQVALRGLVVSHTAPRWQWGAIRLAGVTEQTRAKSGSLSRSNNGTTWSRGVAHGGGDTCECREAPHAYSSGVVEGGEGQNQRGRGEINRKHQGRSSLPCPNRSWTLRSQDPQPNETLPIGDLGGGTPVALKRAKQYSLVRTRGNSTEELEVIRSSCLSARITRSYSSTS